jgi:hypothetical protein
VSYNEPPNYGTPPPPPPGGYGMPGQPGYGGQPQQTSVLAIVSLVTGILGVLCCGSLLFSIAALVTGFLGKKEIDEGRKTGKGMALAGLILGALGVVLSVVWIILVIAGNVDFNAYSDL